MLILDNVTGNGSKTIIIFEMVIVTMNIKDIAKSARVSVSTVSRVLNNHPDVSEATRKQVKDEIEKFHFTPNANAKTLKQQRTKNIAIIVKGANNVLFQNMIELLERQIAKAGYMSVPNFIDQYEDELNVAQLMTREKKPQGIIFLGANINNFRIKFSKIKIPCVIATTSAQDLPFSNLSSVSVDDFAAGKMALDYLFSMGHRNIVILGDDGPSSFITQLRFNGCMESYKNHSIAFDHKYLIKCGFDIEKAYECIKAAIAGDMDISAIFAMSDLMAIGAAKAVTDSGLRVPDDISVMGFDGIEIAKYYYPTLTTIKQPIKDMTKKTVEILMKNINSEHKGNLEPIHIIFQAETLIGHSVKNCREA